MIQTVSWHCFQIKNCVRLVFSINCNRSHDGFLRPSIIYDLTLWLILLHIQNYVIAIARSPAINHNLQMMHNVLFQCWDTNRLSWNYSLVIPIVLSLTLSRSLSHTWNLEVSHPQDDALVLKNLTLSTSVTSRMSCYTLVCVFYLVLFETTFDRSHKKKVYIETLMDLTNSLVLLQSTVSINICLERDGTMSHLLKSSSSLV